MGFEPTDDAECLAAFDTLWTTLSAAHADKVKYHKFHVTILFHYLLTATTVPTPTALQVWFKNTFADIKLERDAGVRDEVVRAGLLTELHETIRADAEGVLLVAPAKRRAIPKKKRDELWMRHFGTSGTGICQCCASPILFTKWEQAHIVAVASGGSNDLENLVPTCVSCNRSCGAEDLRDWCAREYPRAPFLTADDE
jgi:hypothetical protein